MRLCYDNITGRSWGTCIQRARITALRLTHATMDLNLYSSIPQELL
jgi:hypothetical protein